MTNFSDQLFTDLMHEHGATLRSTGLPAASRRHPGLKRGAWAAGGAGALAVGITASLAALGGTASAAYAVSPHSDGTLTVSLSGLSGVTGANAALHKLGMRVVVVPAKDGCPPLPAPRPGSGGVSGSVTVGVAPTGNKQAGTVTVRAQGIPAGDVLVIAVASHGGAIRMAAQLTTAPAPACVSLPAGDPGDGHTFRSHGGPGAGGPVIKKGDSKVSVTRPGLTTAGPGLSTSGG